MQLLRRITGFTDPAWRNSIKPALLDTVCMHRNDIEEVDVPLGAEQALEQMLTDHNRPSSRIPILRDDGVGPARLGPTEEFVHNTARVVALVSPYKQTVCHRAIAGHEIERCPNRR